MLLIDFVAKMVRSLSELKSGSFVAGSASNSLNFVELFNGVVVSRLKFMSSFFQQDDRDRLGHKI